MKWAQLLILLVWGSQMSNSFNPRTHTLTRYNETNSTVDVVGVVGTRSEGL